MTDSEHRALLETMGDVSRIPTEGLDTIGTYVAWDVTFRGTYAPDGTFVSRPRVTLEVLAYERGYRILGAGVEGRGGNPDEALKDWTEKMRGILAE